MNIDMYRDGGTVVVELDVYLDGGTVSVNKQYYIDHRIGTPTLFAVYDHYPDVNSIPIGVNELYGTNDLFKAKEALMKVLEENPEHHCAEAIAAGIDWIIEQ